MFSSESKGVILAVAIIYFSGCASIISGKHQDIGIKSNPAGAHVLIDGMVAGKTPLITEVKRKHRHQITLQKEGYLDEMRMTKRGYNWWHLGNILIGGIVGIIIDFATGAVYSVEPEEINVSMLEGKSSLDDDESIVAGEVKIEAEGDTMTDILSIEKLGELRDKGLVTEEEFQKKKKEILGV